MFAGVARGVIQRAVLGQLLAGKGVRVPVTAKTTGRRGPAGMTAGAWQGMQRRLRDAGYCVERTNDDYASGCFDLYRIRQMLPQSDVEEVL